MQIWTGGSKFDPPPPKQNKINKNKNKKSWSRKVRSVLSQVTHIVYLLFFPCQIIFMHYYNSRNFTNIPNLSIFLATKKKKKKHFKAIFCKSIPVVLFSKYIMYSIVFIYVFLFYSIFFFSRICNWLKSRHITSCSIRLQDSKSNS